LVQAGALVCAALLPAGAARASGPVERLLQTFAHPSDPNVIVVRYGVPGGRASNGFLFSSDGGKTFKAACSDLIKPELPLQRSSSPYVSAVSLDPMGRLTISQSLDEVFVGDTSGCSFSKVAGFTTRTGVSMAVDATEPNVLYMLAYVKDTIDAVHASSEVMRRDASGAWTSIGPISAAPANQSVYGSDLLVGRLPSGATRMVTLYATWLDGDAPEKDTLRIGISDDGGKSWREHPLADPPPQTDIRLLALDPMNPDRVLAVQFGDGVRDKLLLSSDKGVTYQPWAEVDQFSGVTFGAGGRVFISSTSDSINDSVGGLYSATRLGEPLTKLPASGNLDCVHYRAVDQKLFGCALERFGTLDATSGALTVLVSLDRVPSLIECPGKDTKQLCEAQLNNRASWCCAGHFPFTPFCGDYDVTRTPSGQPALCGLSGREYDREAGRGPPSDGGMPDGGAPNDAGPSDAGLALRDAAVARDAGQRLDGSTGGGGDDDDEPEPRGNKGDDGCSVNASPLDNESLGAAFASFGLLLITIGRRFRRRTRA
jgi:hypothetical protein